MSALVLSLDPEVLEAMRARLDRHLFGKAKALSPNAVKATELAVPRCDTCGTRLVDTEDGGGWCPGCITAEELDEYMHNRPAGCR